MTTHLSWTRGGAACGAAVEDINDLTADMNFVECEKCVAVHDNIEDADDGDEITIEQYITLHRLSITSERVRDRVAAGYPEEKGRGDAWKGDVGATHWIVRFWQDYESDPADDCLCEHTRDQHNEGVYECLELTMEGRAKCSCAGFLIAHQSKRDLHFQIGYSMGSAHKGEPEITDVLASMSMDFSGYYAARDFEDWAGDYGYDPDSRRAEAIYDTIGRQSADWSRAMATGMGIASITLDGGVVLDDRPVRELAAVNTDDY